MSQELKQSIEGLIQAIQQNPEVAKAVFETSTILKDGVSVETSIRQFTLHADEGPSTGGQDSAPNPLEYLAASLGACQAITYRALATLKGIKLNGLEVRVKGFTDLNGFLAIDTKIRPGYLKVEFETIIDSDEKPARLKALAEAVETLCPVLDIFSKATPVKGRLVIEKSEQLVA